MDTFRSDPFGLGNQFSGYRDDLEERLVQRHLHPAFPRWIGRDELFNEFLELKEVPVSHPIPSVTRTLTLQVWFL